jgi:hypothetical protein
MTAAPFSGQGRPGGRANAHRQVIRTKQTDTWRPCSGTKPIWLTPPSKTGSGQACWQSTQLQPICATAHPQGEHSVLCSRLCCADQVVGEGFSCWRQTQAGVDGTEGTQRCTNIQPGVLCSAEIPFDRCRTQGLTPGQSSVLTTTMHWASRHKQHQYSVHTTLQTVESSSQACASVMCRPATA